MGVLGWGCRDGGARLRSTKMWDIRIGEGYWDGEHQERVGTRMEKHQDRGRYWGASAPVWRNTGMGSGLQRCGSARMWSIRMGGLLGCRSTGMAGAPGTSPFPTHLLQRLQME